MGNRGIYTDKDYLDDKFREIHSELSTIKSAIYGNGQKGVLDRVTAIEYKTRWIIFFICLLFGTLVYQYGYIDIIKIIPAILASENSPR